MRRLFASLTALSAAIVLTIGLVVSFTAATAPETAVSASVAPSPSPTAQEPAIGGVEEPEAVEGRTAQYLVIDDIRRFDWRPGLLTPPDFDNVFEVLDASAGYGGTSETLRLMLAHATSEGNPRGPSPGNAWLTLVPGDTVTIPSGDYTVTEVWDAHKSDYSTQPPLDTNTWAEYNGALVLVTCVPRPPAEDGSFRSATDNRWVVLRPVN